MKTDNRQLRRVFMQRTRSIFRHQQERAKKALQRLDYDLAQLRTLVEAVSDCLYCERSLTPAIVSVDHRQPISRGGTFEFRNLIVCCHGCNLAKHDLTESEFRDLLSLLIVFPPRASSSVLRRLKFGGNAFRPRKAS